jgi:outer membrane receptor protein involved in Fe transport
MTAAYTYLDAEITSDAADIIGNRPARVPEHQASLRANYEVGSGVLEGLSVGAGARYIGASFGDSANTVNVPGHMLVDAALRYKKNGWQARSTSPTCSTRPTIRPAMRPAATRTSVASMAKALSSRAASA